MAVEMRTRFAALTQGWARRGHELGFGVGIATGMATLGRIGFEGRYDYGMVGRAVIIAARLSSAAAADQILLEARAQELTTDVARTEPVGELSLKGFSRPIPTVNVLALREGAGEPPGPNRMGAAAASTG
jgi:class 3 adenylate cyclase